MDAVVCKTRKALVLLGRKDFGFIRLRRMNDSVRDLAKIHRNTPTFTFRKRAGEAPWPVPMICMGSPFPQFGVPQRVQCFSLVMASHAFQKSGVIPAYVQFFSKRPRLPFLIS